MATTTNMKMVNGRVNTRSVDKATRILEREGLTMSAFIRNSIENIARTGIVPESGKAQASARIGHEHLRSVVANLEAKPMPGKARYAKLGEDELVELLRMGRYGY